MEQFLDQLIIFFNNQSNFALYLFLFVSAVMENLFPPVPGDTMIAFGGFLAGQGRLSFSLAFFVTTLGSFVGFIMLFYLGHFLGKKFFLKKNYRIFPAARIDTTEKWFLKYGYFLVIINRFIPAIRSVISIVAGISKLDALKVSIYCTISAAIWNLIWMMGGFLLGDNWDIVKVQLSYIIEQYTKIFIALTVILLIAYIVVKTIRILKRPT